MCMLGWLRCLGFDACTCRARERFVKLGLPQHFEGDELKLERQQCKVQIHEEQYCGPRGARGDPDYPVDTHPDWTLSIFGGRVDACITVTCPADCR